MLFHAQDDSNVPVDESVECNARLEQQGRQVTLSGRPHRGHYDAMLRQGTPARRLAEGLGPGAVTTAARKRGRENFRKTG